MDKRDQHQQEQAGGEKPDTLIHDQIDHERATFDTQRLRKRCRWRSIGRYNVQWTCRPTIVAGH
jgi:hypothetical protein